MRRDHDQFMRRGYDVVVIGHGTPARARKFQADLNLPFPILGDWDQQGYAAFGLGRAGLSDMLRPAMYLSGLRATLAGSRQGRTDGDPAQLPGTFILDHGGIVRYAKPAAHAGDLASTTDLLAWIDAHDGSSQVAAAAD